MPARQSSPDRDDHRDRPGPVHPRRVMAGHVRSGWLFPARRSPPSPPMSTTALIPAAAGASFRVDTGSFLTIVATSAVAATIVAVAGGRNLFVPVVVVELALGVLIGPQALVLAKVDEVTTFFADLGLGMLFFFAGYEIDIARIRGHPLRLALLGWAPSLGLPSTPAGPAPPPRAASPPAPASSSRSSTSAPPSRRPRSARSCPSCPTRARCAPGSARICSRRAPSGSSGPSCCSRSFSRRRARSTTR